MPLSIIMSGLSFGFFLGCGSLIRNKEILYNKNEPIFIEYFKNGKIHQMEDPLWIQKIRINQEILCSEFKI